MKSHEDVSWVDRAVFAAFLSSAAFCLFCSAFFHMSSSHSKDVCASQSPYINQEHALITVFKVATRCNALDYSGIIGKTSRSLFETPVVTIP
jgi:adiponectin receptor